MAYISAQEVKVIRQDLKEAFPDFKFAISLKSGHLGVSVRILSGPLRFDDDSAHCDINHYHLHMYKNEKVLQKILAVINKKNFDKSDVQSDYFHVGFYVDISQGDYDKPYVVVPFKSKGAEMLFRVKHDLVQEKFDV